LLSQSAGPKKHLGKFFAAHDFVTPLKKRDIKQYKMVRKGKAAVGTINRELAFLHRCLVLGNDDELISVAIPKMEKFDETPFIRMGVVSEATTTRSCAGCPLTRSRYGASRIAPKCGKGKC
jgi:hypothetical protein